MAVYYPQGIMTLRVALENFGNETDTNLNELHVFSVVCKQLNVNLNSYREADTFSATLDYKNFPFDPRSIRSVGVTIHVEDRKKLFRTNNSLNLLNPSAETTIFQGFADKDSINLSEEQRTVTLEGRDFTSLLIDREYLGPPIELSKPVDQVIQGLLDLLPATSQGENKGIKVKNVTGETLPVIANFGEDKAKLAGKKNTRKKRSYWDHIQRIIEQAGLISYIELNNLVISKPRTLYSNTKKKMFIYGQNLKDLTFERKLGRQKGFNVRVLSMSFKDKKVIDAKIPEQASEEWAKDIGIKRERIKIPEIKADGTKDAAGKDAPFITFRVRDVANHLQLVKIGEKIYEEMGRQQIEGSFTTKEMTICETDGKNINPFNATEFRIGSPLEVVIDQGDLEGLPKLLENTKGAQSKNKIKQFLIKNCYQPRIAAALAETLVNFNTPFYTKSVEFNLDQESGWSMDINFINFIELPENLKS